MQGQRHAEIAGAGLAGLAMAAALGKRGWSVRVHERGHELREIGAGIMVWANGLAALESLGAREEATARAEPLQFWELFDERERLLQRDWMHPESNDLFGILRTDLHRALHNAALRAGAEIVTDSQVASAAADGTLTLRSGERLKADLVVGADGVNSRVRSTIGIPTRVRDLLDGCGRHLIPRRPTDIKGSVHEVWDGGRRVGIVPCTPDEVYVYMCCPIQDIEGREQTFARDTWIKSFPHLGDILERIPDGGRWASFADTKVETWSRGKVAVVGDAAHAMSPNLGQAACMAMCNAVALGQALDVTDNDVRKALEMWERSERPITDLTQRYSRFYGAIGTHWPRRLLTARSALVWGIARSPRLQRHINAAAYHTPSIDSRGASNGHAKTAVPA
ncbi:MAG: monooxygenase [Solirubrobacterales bacterium]|nr:monooxygenase [Solirubrobacterales bacterium]